MSNSEIFDAALRAYRALGGKLLLATAIPALFCLAAIGFVEEFILPALFTTNHAGNTYAQIGEASITIVVGVLVGGPLLLFGISLATATVVGHVSCYLNSTTIDPRKAQDDVNKSIPNLLKLSLRELFISLSGIGLSVIVLILAGLLQQWTSETSAIAGLVAVIGSFGLFLGFLVFLWVISTHSLCAPISVVERLKPSATAKRSRNLLKSTAGAGAVTIHPSGNGTVWGLYVILGFLWLAETMGFAMIEGILGVQEHLKEFLVDSPFATIISRCIEIIPAYFCIWTLLPFWATTITIIYYERRIRLEGYDIEALAQDIRPDRRPLA